MVRSNGEETSLLGVDKATFIPLEGKDFMDSQYLSEEVDHSWFTHIQMVKALFILLEGVMILSFSPKSGNKRKWVFMKIKNTLIKSQHSQR